MKLFDVWEFPEVCKGCGYCDNKDKKEPITYLDFETRLCEECFVDKYTEEE